MEKLFIRASRIPALSLSHLFSSEMLQSTLN
jgi:hypothetical protein